MTLPKSSIDCFASHCERFASMVHANAVQKGWWDEPGKHTVERILLLIHSEVSEATEALREGNRASGKIPDFSKLEEELADVVLRALDLAEGAELNLSEAIVAKHRYNLRRPKKHGGKAF